MCSDTRFAEMQGARLRRSVADPGEGVVPRQEFLDPPLRMPMILDR